MHFLSGPGSRAAEAPVLEDHVWARSREVRAAQRYRLLSTWRGDRGEENAFSFHMCVICLCVHICGGQGQRSAVFITSWQMCRHHRTPQLPGPPSWSEAEPLLYCHPQGCRLRGLPSASHLRVAVLTLHVCACPAIFVGSADLNPHPHVCRAST